MEKANNVFDLMLNDLYDKKEFAKKINSKISEQCFDECIALLKSSIYLYEAELQLAKLKGMNQTFKSE